MLAVMDWQPGYWTPAKIKAAIMEGAEAHRAQVETMSHRECVEYVQAQRVLLRMVRVRRFAELLRGAI